MKQALIVQVCFQTRIIAEVDKDEIIQNWDEVVNQVKNNLIAKINNDEVDENIECTMPDTECPYGTIKGDKC